MEDGVLASSRLKEIRLIRSILADQGVSDFAKVGAIVPKVLQKIDEGEQLEKATLDEAMNSR